MPKWCICAGLFIFTMYAINKSNGKSRAPATVRHCRQFRKKYWIGDYGLAVGENFGALVFSSIHSHFHIIVVATIILCSPDICVYPPPSRKDENSSQRKPNHLVYSTPSSSSNWDNISVGGGRTNFFFLGAAFFHGYFLFNLAPRGAQLATKMAPAFLGLAGALKSYNFFISIYTGRLTLSLWASEGIFRKSKINFSNSNQFFNRKHRWLFSLPTIQFNAPPVHKNSKRH